MFIRRKKEDVIITKEDVIITRQLPLNFLTVVCEIIMVLYDLIFDLVIEHVQCI